MADESEWCERHLEEMDARRAELNLSDRPAPSTSRFKELLEAINDAGDGR